MTEPNNAKTAVDGLTLRNDANPESVLQDLAAGYEEFGFEVESSEVKPVLVEDVPDLPSIRESLGDLLQETLDRTEMNGFKYPYGSFHTIQNKIEKGDREKVVVSGEVDGKKVQRTIKNADLFIEAYQSIKQAENVVGSYQDMWMFSVTVQAPNRNEEFYSAKSDIQDVSRECDPRVKTYVKPGEMSVEIREKANQALRDASNVKGLMDEIRENMVEMEDDPYYRRDEVLTGMYRRAKHR